MTQSIEQHQLSPDVAPRSLQAFLGLGLAAFGAVVMLGWMLHLPRVVQLDTTSQVVVFNAALMFFLGGAALCLGSARPGNMIQGVLGCAVGIVAASMLLQDFVVQNLGLSWSALHAWLPRMWFRPPGTMNPSPAFAFLCCGIALALMNRVRGRRAAVLVNLFIALAIVIPAFDLIGNIIHLEWLYPGYQYWRMALGTACAMLVLALTVWLAWLRTNWMRAQPPLPADRKITYLAAWILAGLTLTTGVATFAMLQSRVEDAFGEERLALLKTRTTMVSGIIEGKLSAMEFITSRPNLQRQLRKLAAGQDHDLSAATAEEVLLGFLKLGFSALAVRGPDGRELLRVGSSVTAPKLSVQLNTGAPASLLWVDGQQVMRGERSIVDSQGKIATLIAEQPMPELSSFMLNEEDMGKTGDMGLCARKGDRLFCFPQRLRMEVYDLPLTNSAGELFPMSRALAGETGVIKTLDYRNQSVIAAFGPVADLGLGMVIKIDLEELYTPIRERLAPVVFLMVIFASLGVVAIRLQVAPLASRLLASEQQTQAANIALQEQARALGASERRFRDTIEYAPIGMAIASLQGRWTDVNHAFCEIVGYDKEELEQLTIQDLISPEDAPIELSHVDRLLRNEAQSYQRTTQYMRKDGGIAWVLMTASLLRDDLGKPLSLIVQILDITERKQAEGEIRQLNAGLKRRTQELTMANAELQTFSYSVAHDLRAPLRQITGFSQILMEEHGDQLNADARKYLDKVHQGARQMGHLVDDLLNLAQVGRQALSLQKAPLASILQTALEEVQPECSGRNVEWQIGDLFTVECDRGLMKLVFVNLLSNALKYSRGSDRTIIQVGQTTIKGKQAVFVRDNGVGFDMRYAGKLFGVFERLHKAKDFEGTGVGLATVERIIRKHGGLIWAHAEQGEGATFFFTIGSATG